MLHEFGRSETEVLKSEQLFYLNISEIIDSFVAGICIQLEAANADLEKRVNAVFYENSEEGKLLDRIYKKIVQGGCPDLSGATIDLLNPINNMRDRIYFL